MRVKGADKCRGVRRLRTLFGRVFEWPEKGATQNYDKRDFLTYVHTSKLGRGTAILKKQESAIR